MARAHLRYVVKDTAGNVLQNALVYVFAAGTASVVTDPPTGTAITGSMYAAASGGSAITSPLTTNAQGEAEAWLATAQSVDLAVYDNSDGAYYPAAPTITKSWTAFSERAEVYPAPEDIGGGGDISQTTVSIAYNDTFPKTLYTPAVGETLFLTLSFMRITTAWDGTSPAVYIGRQGSSSLTLWNEGWPFWTPGSAEGSQSTYFNIAGATGAPPANIFTHPYPYLWFTDTAPLVATVVNDNDGSADDSAQGAGAIHLFIGSAP